MIKKNELEDPGSCLNKARLDERVFVLLARDKAAPSTIRFWVKERIRLKKNNRKDHQIVEALECALKMEVEYVKQHQEGGDAQG